MLTKQDSQIILKALENQVSLYTSMIDAGKMNREKFGPDPANHLYFTLQEELKKIEIAKRHLQQEWDV